MLGGKGSEMSQRVEMMSRDFMDRMEKEDVSEEVIFELGPKE